MQSDPLADLMVEGEWLLVLFSSAVAAALSLFVVSQVRRHLRHRAARRRWMKRRASERTARQAAARSSASPAQRGRS